jgi:hypothetical protein
VANTRSFVDADQVRTWCGVPGTTVTVKPVLDLAEHLHVDQYQVPDRLADQAAERDLTCVFPWCTRPAEHCDTDHVIPYSEGGQTASDNLAPLCRRHHRLKTHHVGWGYTVLEPGSYLWHRRTATSSCATTAAPPTSPATRHRIRPTSSDPAPHPAPHFPARGHRHVPGQDEPPGTYLPTQHVRSARPRARSSRPSQPSSHRRLTPSDLELTALQARLRRR